MEEGVDPESPHFGVMRVEDSKCTGCRECQNACPYDAIFVFRRDQAPAFHQPSIAA
jgi:Fe-S-cluster-containing dehydrogenase component